jgi:hypothetical protein
MRSFYGIKCLQNAMVSYNGYLGLFIGSESVPGVKLTTHLSAVTSRMVEHGAVLN